MLPTILIDTNVYGYAVEEDTKSEDSKHVLKYGKEHKEKSYGTLIIVTELYESKQQEKLLELFSSSVGFILELEISERLTECSKLAWEYLQKLRLEKGSLPDCRLLAMATIAGVDIIITWNRRGVFSENLLKKVEKINTENGYKTPKILTPSEFLSQISS